MTTETLTTLANARDLADAAPGLRRGLVWRSDAPLAGDEAPAGLAPWPPATVLDLRDARETGGGHPFAASSTVRSLPVLADAALEADNVGSSMRELYQVMITGSSATVLVDVVTAIATEEGPVLFHCAAGKDRTGVSAAIVLALLGVSREEIIADYVLTTANMPGVTARMAATWAAMAEAAGIAQAYDLSKIPADAMLAPRDAIEGVLDAWDALDGGVHAWFLAHGGAPETVDALRERLLG
ncbi:tyrosine-protein phosphatase [Demequina iriomotensis]|uniref:tyrosine-protein phosphatase n=1 Tax=Demequina iriomotensis TaxID=1536641 RepID=UPI0007860B41|nr:tyrosine-protein phosphatase [Demequina iriomotensis]